MSDSKIKNPSLSHVGDPLAVMQNSIELFKLRYEKYMDKTALDLLDNIQKSSVKLQKELL